MTKQELHKFITRKMPLLVTTGSGKRVFPFISIGAQKEVITKLTDAIYPLVDGSELIELPRNYPNKK